MFRRFIDPLRGTKIKELKVYKYVNDVFVGISFEFMYKEESKASSKEIEFGFEGDYEKWDHDSNTPSLNTSYEEDFLDSIGLNKKEHFPSIEAQQRLTMKSRLRSVDNRLESTIKIKNCQGLFNFLLNANFLCSPSGAMTGVPPTLISPSPFEGGTLCKCKISNGPIKQQRKSSTQTVSGFIFILCFSVSCCIWKIVLINSQISQIFPFQM